VAQLPRPDGVRTGVRRRCTALLALVAALAALPATAAAGTGALSLQRVGTFDDPVFVTAAPGDSRRLFVVEQTGRIRVVRGGRVLPRPFLDVSGRIVCCGEQGLLSMAFAPDYERTGRFYVYFTDRAGDTRVEERRRASADRASTARRLVLRVDQPEANHNGGLLLFGPDRLLYVGLGDGGGANDRHGRRGNAQNRNSLLGKILRIDPRPAGRRPYRIPRSNPFVGRAGRNEIYSYGLRNPWRFSFDRATGDLVVADVGQGGFEEVNFSPRGTARGANFGWRVWEGRRRNFPGERAPGAVFPVLTYPTSRGCAVTGGYVVRDRALRGWEGRYLYGDFCNGDIRSVRLSRSRASGDATTGLDVPQLSSFGEDNAGRVYVTSLRGPVYRLTAR
jgi:glucose/arabinose dehydrogenase